MKKFVFFLILVFLIGCTHNPSNRESDLNPGQIRGFTAYTSLTEQDLIDAKAFGANCLRLMLMLGDLHDLTGYQTCPLSAILPEKLERLQEILGWCQTHDIILILDVHEIPGLVRWSQEMPDLVIFTQGQKDFRLWDPERGQPFRDLLVDTWRQLAIAFKDKPRQAVIFELFNEPEPKENDGNAVENSDKARLWYDLQFRLAREIRNFDQQHVIIGSPAYSWRISSLREWQPELELIGTSDFWVAAHFYHPHTFTHQFSPPYNAYPGEFAESLSLARDQGNFYWDKYALEVISKPIAEFQDQYGLPVIVTEFSTLKWTPGGSQWLKDVTDILKVYGVGWTYHAWRERYHNNWEGWDLESGEADRLQTISQAMK